MPRSPEAGCTFADVVRVRYLLPDRDDFEPCFPTLRRTFGDVRPAATMMVCGLSDPRMKIEIEVDARSGAGSRGVRHDVNVVCPPLPVAARSRRV